MDASYKKQMQHDIIEGLLLVDLIEFSPFIYYWEELKFKKVIDVKVNFYTFE